MQIDWFTTAAQVVNFLILIWLLKKLLYRPVIHAMQRREQGLVDRQQQLDAQLNDAEQLKQQYELCLQQLKMEQDAVLSRIKQQAEDERNRQLANLDQEIQQKKQEFAEQMNKERGELGQTISRTIAQQAVQIGNKILRELADRGLEEQMIEHFLGNLAQLPEQEREILHAAITRQHQVRIFTGFTVSEKLQKDIRARLAEIAGCEIVFSQRENLLCGITLEAGGRSWEWNVDRYLTELDDALTQIARHRS